MMMVVVHTQDRGNTVQVVFHSEDKGDIIPEESCDMMMMVVVPTQILTSVNESSLQLLFPFYDL